MLAELAGIGVVEVVSKGRRKAYRLSRNPVGRQLTELVVALKRQLIDYELWMSPRLKGQRLKEALKLRGERRRVK